MNTANLAVMGPSERLPVVQSETTAMIGMVERLARDPSVPMERIQGLMEMIRELRREQAEEAFNEAMAETQQDITSVARDSFNPQTRSKYASYHAVDKAIRPAYTRHGMSVSFDEGDGAPENYIRVIAFVAKGRHTRTYHYDSPVVTKGLKGNDMMTLTHGRSSAVTYGKRYLVGMIFNLSTGEDDDGNAAGSGNGGIITAEQAAALTALAHDVGADLSRTCAHFEIETIDQLPSDKFARVKAGLDSKRVPL